MKSAAAVLLLTAQQSEGFSAFAGTKLSSGASNTQLMVMQTPIINDWKIEKRGQLVGTVRNHPSIDDGDTITTSPLANPDGAKANIVVQTKTGSKYKLGRPSKEQLAAAAPPPPKANGRPAAAVKKKAAPVEKKTSGGGGGFFGFGGAKKNNGVETPAAAPKARVQAKPKAAASPKQTKQPPATALTQDNKARQEKLREAKIKLGLTGQVIGEKYLLAGKPARSTSGKSTIWTAYAQDKDGLPTGSALTVKVSPSAERMKRESENYRKITSGLNSGKFVKFVEYLIPAGSSKPFDTQVALVLERGDVDLKKYIALNGAFKGKALREAAVAGVQCLQACHSSGLVWTDMKTENFVVRGKGDLLGIDLESAIPHKNNPVDFSPEACPPEFAAAFVAGDGPYFVLDYNYDIWSLGMFLYEISTGKGLFDKKTPAQITSFLKNADFQADVSAVKDDLLRGLISDCLTTDPKKRPSLTNILLHPYFLTTGIGALSF